MSQKEVAHIKYDDKRPKVGQTKAEEAMARPKGHRQKGAGTVLVSRGDVSAYITCSLCVCLGC